MGHFKVIFKAFWGPCTPPIAATCHFLANPMSIHYNWVNWINDWDFLWKINQIFEFWKILVILGHFWLFSPTIPRPSYSWGHSGSHLWCPGASPNYTTTTKFRPAHSETIALIWNTPLLHSVGWANTYPLCCNLLSSGLISYPYHILAQYCILNKGNTSV